MATVALGTDLEWWKLTTDRKWPTGKGRGPQNTYNTWKEKDMASYGLLVWSRNMLGRLVGV
jgi:hypothetical protein